MSDLRIVPGRTRGLQIIRHKDGYQVAVLSWMDAAELLWQLKDLLRSHSMGRECVDAVHARRLREAGDE